MKVEAEPALEGNEATANQSARDASFVDTKAQFEVWLDTLKPGRHAGSTNSKFPAVVSQADFLVECDQGTDCRIVFTGLLDFSGFLSGSLQSDNGSLVTRARGRINADIEVAGTASIDSEVNGNINATGRVVLNSNARVIGNIKAPALSVKQGAIFEGDCVFQEGREGGRAENYETAEEVGFLSASAAGD